MLKKHILTAAMILLATVSCDKKNTATTNISEEVSVETTAADSVILDSSAQPVQEVAVNSQPQVIAAATAPGINPPHGQPNHRCDIPVGAPLSTPVQAQQPQPMINTGFLPQDNAVTTPAPQTQPVQATAPGMNPPHGQPGHICEIPVGAPLPAK